MRQPIASRARLYVAQVLFLVLLVTGWIVLTNESILDPFVFGSPESIGGYLAEWVRDRSILQHAGHTLMAFGLGYACALIVGMAIGALISASDIANRTLDPFIAFFNALPRLMFYPFFAIWLGFGLAPKVMHVVFVVVFLVIFNTAAGVREVDKTFVSGVMMMGGGRMDLIRHVYLPSIASWLISSSRVMVGVGFQAAIVAEFIGAARGLGYLVSRGQARFNVDEVFAAILVMVVFAIVLDGLLSLVERRALRWKPDVH